ncbi:MAG TPA: bifunctional 4-hydroxy-2-oxoglutarate aldolase/2-dehydro-3-deoxy-phosphogluconate aldolase [Candidatus Dormibacteraeota bacterium]|nr:bifunctional 4-hydroxy-2-oxoglutarate aldolase/2-dehydro-3-deoxy-phosphogluconate aldolase [Candidatus Dormibacteraeota bacterium]
MTGAPAVDRLIAARLIGIVRLDDLEQTVAAASRAVDAGLEVIEVTFTLACAARAIERLRRDHPEALVGAGTVRQVAQLEEAAAAGAQFLVAPGLNPTLVEAARRRELPLLPGVFTASEVDMGLRLGAELLKLFPAEPSGPGYLAAMLQPFPEAKLVPTGGITAANAAAYLDAGAVAVAMGSSLFPAARISAEGPDMVVQLIREALAAVNKM